MVPLTDAYADNASFGMALVSAVDPETAAIPDGVDKFADTEPVTINPIGIAGAAPMVKYAAADNLLVDVDSRARSFINGQTSCEERVELETLATAAPISKSSSAHAVINPVVVTVPQPIVDTAPASSAIESITTASATVTKPSTASFTVDPQETLDFAPMSKSSMARITITMIVEAIPQPIVDTATADTAVLPGTWATGRTLHFVTAEGVLVVPSPQSDARVKHVVFEDEAWGILLL
jgi:hypothetical protein